MAGPAEILARREREREELLGLAREYVDRLSRRIEVLAATVVGSVARGDFNVWSDVDVVVIAEGLPGQNQERTALLAADAPGRVQAVGFRPDELEEAVRKSNRLALEAVEGGIALVGEELLRESAQRSRSAS